MCRLTDRFVAYQGSGNLGDSKAAHSSGSQKFWSVQLLSLSPDSGLGDTDHNYFNFYLIFFCFFFLQYSVSVYHHQNLEKIYSKNATKKLFVYFNLVSLQKSWNVYRVARVQDFLKFWQEHRTRTEWHFFEDFLSIFTCLKMFIWFLHWRSEKLRIF